MTNEEIQKLMEFILTSQAASEAWMQRLQGSHDQMTRDIMMLAETQSRMQEQAEADRQQAKADRRETRQAIETMLKIAESMEAMAKGLIQSQYGTS